MRIASIFDPSDGMLLVASRMCSMLSITCCGYYCLKLGNLIFGRRETSTLFAVLTCFVPQVMFLGMYQNNDSFALAGTVAVLYYLVKGKRSRYKFNDCAGLAIWVSVCLLSYYSVYGWLLVAGIFLF